MLVTWSCSNVPLCHEHFTPTFFSFTHFYWYRLCLQNFFTFSKPGRKIRPGRNSSFETSNIVHSYTRNNNRSLEIKPCRTSQQRNFFIRTAVEWNHLDDSTVNLKTLPAFKANIKKKKNNNNKKSLSPPTSRLESALSHKHHLSPVIWILWRTQQNRNSSIFFSFSFPMSVFFYIFFLPVLCWEWW